MSERWYLDEGEMGYLDGVQSDLTIFKTADRYPHHVPVAYAFDKEEALMMTAAPALLEALEAYVIWQEEIQADRKLGDLIPAAQERLKRAKAAIALARGREGADG